MNDTIGIYYQLPDGRIAKVYGRNGATEEISYYFDDQAGGRVTSEAEWQSWVPRTDLKRFPGDTTLPQVFDQQWGLKTFTDLRTALGKRSVEVYEIRATMDEYGIDETTVTDCAKIE
jgi:hypothetical protein